VGTTRPAKSSLSDRGRPSLLIGALGIVYGDIGTSPIYTLRECLRGSGQTADTATILGLLSLIFWSLVIVVTVKYVLIVMRADNHGEGGIMALLGLAAHGESSPSRRTALLMIGLAGAALFYGDGMITPAISVLSAVEGLQVATPMFEPYVVPLAALVLVALFVIQSRGSGRIGFFFGPIMAVWFLVLAAAGGLQLIIAPAVLAAVNPGYGIQFLATHGWTGFLVLGSVFLALTGAEALYADMGHFGRRAIRMDWFLLVLPALVLNYFGQGALVISHPEALDSPFFHLFPDSMLYAATLLATIATVIASQAVISGAFSLSQQAMQLSLLPRLDVRQTSAEAIGQVYVPQMNWLLMVAVIGLVISFRSSAADVPVVRSCVPAPVRQITRFLRMLRRVRYDYVE
jgi:KUP system potassium uptake protein